MANPYQEPIQIAVAIGYRETTRAHIQHTDTIPWYLEKVSDTQRREFLRTYLENWAEYWKFTER